MENKQEELIQLKRSIAGLKGRNANLARNLNSQKEINARLSARYKEIIGKLNKKEAELAASEKRALDLEARINAYNSLSWWERLFYTSV